VPPLRGVLPEDGRYGSVASSAFSNSAILPSIQRVFSW